MALRTRVVRTASVDPWQNQALEAYLLDLVGEDEVIMYLWQNQHTVVIGRNQNPWKECRCQELENTGGKVARRYSGGGAVYHDLGNLNFTFVMKKPLYDLHKQAEVILEAVRALGINAEFTGRNDLTVDGRKFSGNAFYHGKNASYHHGTILLGVNPESLGKYLQVSKDKIASKGVDSVRSRVVNLNSIKPDLTIEKVSDALIASFSKLYAPPFEDRTFAADYDFGPLYQQFSSWEWRYGKTPDFDMTMYNRFPWGSIELGLKVQNARITDATIFSDAMNATLILAIAEGLRGLPLDLHVLAKWVGDFAVSDEDQPVGADIKAWLEAKANETEA